MRGHRGLRIGKTGAVHCLDLAAGQLDPNKTEVCDFTAHKKADETAIVGGICENVGKLSSSCTRVVQSGMRQ